MIFPKDQNVPLEELKKIRIYRPEEAGARWKAVPHHQVIETLKKEAKERGWKLRRPCCVLSNDKAEMAVSWDVIGPPAPREGFVCSLGAVNATNQRERLWLFAGVWMEEEEVGVVLERISVAARRTTSLDLEEKIRASLDLWEEEARGFLARITRLEKQRLSLEKVTEIIEKAHNTKRLSGSRAWKLRKTVGDDPTKWEILLRFAKINQIVPPLNQMVNAYSFLKEILGD